MCSVNTEHFSGSEKYSQECVWRRNTMIYTKIRNAEFVKERLFDVRDKSTREKLARLLNGENADFNSDEIRCIADGLNTRFVRYFIFNKDECTLEKVGFNGWDNEEVFNLKKYIENRMFSKTREKDNFRYSVGAAKLLELDKDTYSVIDFMEVV